MRYLSSRIAWPLALLAILVMAGSPAYGQGNATTLSGVVVDDQGGVVPGADVVAKNNATAVTIQGVTDGSGRFMMAGVAPGTYTVTVTLMGFKTAVAPDIQVVSATPASVKMTLKIGALEETVVVTGATEIVQTQSATVATTIAVKQIQQLPVISHTALDYVVSLPGVETAATQHPRVDHQRPADDGDQHHARRHQRPGQARVRRDVHVHPADDGLGRRGHGVHVERRAPRRAARRGEHPDGDPLGFEPVQRVGLQHLA